MGTTRIPRATQEANEAGAARAHKEAPAHKRPQAPNNRPTKEQLEIAYDKAQAAGDKQAMAALLEAYEVVCPWDF